LVHRELKGFPGSLPNEEPTGAGERKLPPFVANRTINISCRNPTGRGEIFDEKRKGGTNSRRIKREPVLLLGTLKK
jgi:hypothetical protein